ncbi:Wzz/FepE/Etk N-terminal domain-containing protein [Actinoplanes oblitus]|uniref:Wzz/FepE/Etk N-terminal domain-containing protein n=1 Tax=Actinoplanes oblitus TaxID=3040509 RepID=A0ABY8W4V1_9ACTN|nr:Wzz/FepE/Etk N-terminal domain-containing protein [Actinoplanes oblitus]WIM92886.1 Wzz/FepE/Etk N-terminal domain-containing protein [Actinoplanes oblitus]
MNSSSVRRRTLRRIALIVLLALLGGAAGAVYAAVKTPTYTAKAYVVATARDDPATALNFAQAYGRIATSGPVLATARSALSDPTGLSSVRSSTSPDAPVVEIVATGGDPQHTAGLANAVAGALADYANKRSKATTVKLSVLAPATVPARPTSPKPPLELAVGAAAGLLIGGLAALGGGARGEPPPRPEPAPRPAPERVARAMARPPSPRTATIPVFAMPPPAPTSNLDAEPPAVGRAVVDGSEDER